MTKNRAGPEDIFPSEIEIVRHTKAHCKITVDYEKYARFLENSNLSEMQKQELLQALWNIIASFVSLGFGVHPLQQMESRPCGQIANEGELSGAQSPNLIESEPANQLKGSNKLAAQFKSAGI